MNSDQDKEDSDKVPKNSEQDQIDSEKVRDSEQDQ